jgi:hypothetical protein
MLRKLFLILLFAGFAFTANAARQEAPLENKGSIISRLQNLFSELELYKGPTDGQPSKAFRDAAALYRQNWGLDPLGPLDDEFLRHVEKSASMLQLQRRLKDIKDEQIAEARLALSSSPAVRELLQKPPPTRRAVDIASCLRAADVNCLLTGALESALGESDERHREWALHDVISAEARSGQASQALSIASYFGDPRSLLQAFREIAENLAEAGHISQAVAIAEIHPDPRGKAEALIFVALAQTGQKLENELLGKINDPQGRIHLLSKMSQIHFRLGENAAAANDLHRARSILQELEFEARPSSKGLIAAALAANADPRGAILEMNGINDADLIAPVRMAAVEAYAKSDNLDAALSQARAIPIPRYRIISLSRLAPLIAKAGRKNEANQVLDEALKAAPMIELVYARSYATSKVAAARLEIGDREWSLNEAIKIEDDQLRAQTLWNIVDSNGQPGKSALSEAEKAGAAIPEPFARVYMFAQLAMAATRAGDLPLATRHFARATKAAEPISSPFLRARALSTLALALLEIVK